VKILVDGYADSAFGGGELQDSWIGFRGQTCFPRVYRVYPAPAK
jgi:hypothetical protein